MISPMPMLQTANDGVAGAGTNGGRRPTVVPAPATPSPELSDRPRCRTFTAQDKLRTLAETDRAAETGAIGAILRREGLYSLALTDWRRQRDAGASGALAPAKRGPKTAEPSQLAADPARVQHDNARLALRLKRAKAIIELQNKLRSCWASRWPRMATSRDGRVRGARLGQRHDRGDLRRARGFACQRAAWSRPAHRLAGDPPPETKARAGADRPTTAGGSRSAACATFR